MNNWLNMYVVELKKIVSKKSLWIAAFIGMVMLLLMEASNLVVTFRYTDGKVIRGREYFVMANEKGSELSGQIVDDAFLNNIRNTVASYAIDAGYITKDELKAVRNGSASGIMLNTVSDALMEAAEECGIANAYALLLDLTSNIGQTLTITADEMYASLDQRVDKIYSVNDGSEAEKLYWMKKYQEVNKPITYYYTFGYQVFFDRMYAYIWLLIIMITICMAGIFSEERSTKMDALILCSRNGRTVLAKSKIMAGITVGILLSVLLFLINAANALLLYGASGSNASLQYISLGTAWNITVGKAFWVYFILTIVLGIFLSCLVMLLSQLFSSTQVTVIMMALFIISFFELPEILGVISKLWELRPGVMLHRTIFTKTHLFGGRLNVFYMSGIMYFVLSVILITYTFFSYKKSQVRSR